MHGKAHACAKDPLPATSRFGTVGIRSVDAVVTYMSKRAPVPRAFFVAMDCENIEKKL